MRTAYPSPRGLSSRLVRIAVADDVRRLHHEPKLVGAKAIGRARRNLPGDSASSGDGRLPAILLVAGRE